MFEDEHGEAIPQDPGDLFDPAAFEAWFQESVVGPPPLIDRLSLSAARATSMAAERFEFLDQLRLEAETETGATWAQRDSLEWRSLRAEVAAALSIHERSAEAQLDLARQLVHVFPDTLQGLRTAQFSERHARILVEQSTGLPEHLLAEFEERLLPYAARYVPSRFEGLARRLRESLAPEGMIIRHREALTMRTTGVQPAPDGMAWYGGIIAAEDAVEADKVNQTIAEGMHGAEGETRTLAQIKADVFRDLLLDAAGVVPPAADGEPPQPSPRARRRVSPTVFVQVPILTAMGKGNAFGILEGYGPIDAETARRLAGTAERWLRILTDPETGTIRSFGRLSYRVPEELRRTLRVRDGVCRFVGCTRPADVCDLDHTVPWEEGGGTEDCNLAYLCKGHHHLKHGGRWKVTQDSDGSGILRWTSGKGKNYTTYPDVVLPPPTPARSPGGGLLIQEEWLAAALTDDPPP